ncbi:hypothetical protein D3C81_1828860 [compost metagenome]
MGKSGLGDGHGKRTQQRIRQGNRGSPAQAAIERLQCALDTQSSNQATHQRADDQSNDHMHARQAQQQHDADRCNNGIHSV